MNKRAIGTNQEIKAAEYLKNQGYEILERNFRCRIGEIDIIARDGRYLVFVEVKYRKSTRYGGAVYAVDYKKQAKISKVADYYMLKNQIPENSACRFDVVAIDDEKIELLKNAFEYRG
ncbi:MAG: YraN family protein [Lachnospiraceae bacterium]|nr:YraN family protein [Lachnospiraceae bacterium]MDD3614901.1 YraN family protein [Lachnospiraceae bacterium]